MNLIDEEYAGDTYPEGTMVIYEGSIPEYRGMVLVVGQYPEGRYRAHPDALALYTPNPGFGFGLGPVLWNVRPKSVRPLEE